MIFGQPCFCVHSLLTNHQSGLRLQSDAGYQSGVWGTYRYHSSSFIWKHVLQMWQAISARGGDFKKGKKNFKIVLKIDTGLTLANVVPWGIWTHRICIREIKPHQVGLGISRKPLNFTGNKVLGVMLLLQGVTLFQTQSNAEAWGPVQDCRCHLWPVLHIRQPFSRRCHKVLHCSFYTTHRCNMPWTLLVGIPPLRTGHNNLSTTAIKPYVCACLPVKNSICPHKSRELKPPESSSAAQARDSLSMQDRLSRGICKGHMLCSWSRGVWIAGQACWRRPR